MSHESSPDRPATPVKQAKATGKIAHAKAAAVNFAFDDSEKAAFSKKIVKARADWRKADDSLASTQEAMDGNDGILKSTLKSKTDMVQLPPEQRAEANAAIKVINEKAAAEVSEAIRAGRINETARLAASLEGSIAQAVATKVRDIYTIQERDPATYPIFSLRTLETILSESLQPTYKQAIHDADRKWLKARAAIQARDESKAAKRAEKVAREQDTLSQSGFDAEQGDHIKKLVQDAVAATKPRKRPLPGIGASNQASAKKQRKNGGGGQRNAANQKSSSKRSPRGNSKGGTKPYTQWSSHKTRNPSYNAKGKGNQNNGKGKGKGTQSNSKGKGKGNQSNGKGKGKGYQGKGKGKGGGKG